MVVQSTRTMASVSVSDRRHGDFLPVFGSRSVVHEGLHEVLRSLGAMLLDVQLASGVFWWPLDDDPARDLKGRDADQVEPSAAGPGLEIELRGRTSLFGTCDQAGVTAHQDTPSLAHGLVDVVDFEGDDARDGGDHGIRGPEDDASVERRRS